MFADVLKKIVPAEVLAMITPERAQHIIASVEEMRDRFATMEANMLKIMEALNVNGSDDSRAASAAISNDRRGDGPSGGDASRKPD